MAFKQQSIAKVVALVLVVVSTVVLGAFSALEYNREKTIRLTQLRTDAASMVAQLAVSLQLPVWNFDHAQIDRIIDSTMRNESVLGIEVQFADANVSRHVRARDENWQPAVSDSLAAEGGYLSVSRDIIADESRIGAVTLSVTSRFIEEAAAQSFEWTLVAIAILDVLLIAGLYYLLKLLVLRPLAQLENQAVALSSGAGQIESLGALQFRGEIESLRRSVATMVQQLRRQFAELTLSEQRFRMLVDGVHDYAIAMLDRDGLVTTWNAGAHRIMGYEAEEIVGSPAKLFHPEDGEDGGLHKQLALARETGRAEWSGWHVRRDGTRFWGDTILTALRDNNELIGFAMISRDLTAQRQMAELKDRLEAQFRHAQKMQAIGSLAGGIAHDFNNVLAAIRGNAVLELENPELPPAVQEPLRQIQRATDRGAALVRRLMTFARPEQPRLVMVSLAELVEEVAALLRATIPAMVTVRTHIAEGARHGLVDEAQIHQVLMNLGTNAAQAIGDSPGQIDISLTVPSEEDVIGTGLKPEACMCLTVSDSGNGMDAATVERIFDPFFTTRADAGGTGLGLAVVQGIVTSHGGRVTVHSRPGAGTTFRILLPGVVQSSTPVPASAPPARHPNTGAGHIMVVDDEKALTILMKIRLENQGFRVAAFTDPKQALQTLRQSGTEFDVLVTDMSMPTMSGLHLVQAVREFLPRLPIVMASGYLRQEDIDACNALGVARMVLKPDQFEQIGQILGELLAPPQAAQAGD